MTFRTRLMKSVIPATAVILISAVAAFAAHVATPSFNTADQAQTFSASGHVLRFAPGSATIAGMDHALKIDFVGAASVMPVSKGRKTQDGTSVPDLMGTITYPDLWKGIDLVYEKEPDGFVKSTYYAEAGVDPSQILLQYNGPVSITDDGSLGITFPTGMMRESTPVAWQERDGKRIPVKASFEVRENNLVGFKLGAYDPALSLVIDPSLTWNTFMGGTAEDSVRGIAVDSSGNSYVLGISEAAWGTPVNAFTGGYDIAVVKLNAAGTLEWNTFLGNSGTTQARGITLDSAGNIYIVGDSGTWGSPINAASGGTDFVVIKLTNSGHLSWNTFLGSTLNETAHGIVLDSGGNIYITGKSAATWGTNVLNAFSGTGTDITVVKLNNAGAYQWNTFYGTTGSAGGDESYGLAIDSAGNLIISGTSPDTWAGPGAVAPKNAFTAGSTNGALLKLDKDGAYQWHTFYGPSLTFSNVAVDKTGFIYAAGFGTATWDGPGSKAPVNPYTANRDMCIVATDKDGTYKWHTFHGGINDDHALDIAMTGIGNLLISGKSMTSWGSPLNAHAGGEDIALVKLDSSGTLVWNTFYGSSGTDSAVAVALDASDKAYIAAASSAAWGTPVNGYAGGNFDMAALKYGPVEAAPAGSVTITSDPADKATDVSRTKTVTLAFSAAMKTSTVDFSMSPVMEKDYTKSWSSDNKTLSIKPKTDWAASTTYTLSVAKTADSTAGGGLSAKFSASFTIKAETAAEAAARVGGTPTISEITATLSKTGITTAGAEQMKNRDGIVMIPDTIAQSGTKGAATGSDADKAAAVADAANFAAVVAEGNALPRFNPKDAVASVKGLEAKSASSTATSPKIIALYVTGYLASGLVTFPECFKANENTASMYQFSYVDELSATKIKAAADGDDIAGYALMNPSTGEIIKQTGSLPALSGGYQLVLFIKDNSQFDQDPAFGCVKDPSYLTSGASSSSSTGGSSSGCMMNPKAAFGLEWLILLLAPFIAAMRNRFEK